MGDLGARRFDLRQALGRAEEVATALADPSTAADPAKLRALGWAPEHSFGEGGLPATVEWYRSNRTWWEPIKSGEYRTYYDEQYANRLKA